MVGFGGVWQIKNVWYYLIFFAINGMFQSLGWPLVLSVMGNWFGKNNRGMLFGIFASNTNVGNILAGLACNILISMPGFDWMWTWMTVNFSAGVLGALNLLFLIDHPEKVSLTIIENNNSATNNEDLQNENDYTNDDTQRHMLNGSINQENETKKQESIGF